MAPKRLVSDESREPSQNASVSEPQFSTIHSTLKTTDLPSTDFGNYRLILECGLIYGRILKCA
ncbi:hypothetical protein E2C01_067320 [Portunus trituberculatus]|uniref:Uncharacterized protein n=1 Tax=Portunus trituberculatus TaxID=210409 RepID=A0A5B7HX52_PORTR|nr:hypothetical protein [Portunus trituberculatus]